MSQYDAAYHAYINQTEQWQAQYTAAYLAQFAPRSVADFGCSTGLYLEPWRKYIPDAMQRPGALIGFESSPEGVQHRRIAVVCQHDLRQPVPGHYDLGLCLEVIEHIPRADESRVLDNVLGAVDRWLLFSGAVPGQPGEGHINCRPREHWMAEVRARGFTEDLDETRKLIAHVAAAPFCHDWFKLNVVFYRRTAVDRPRPIHDSKDTTGHDARLV